MNAYKMIANCYRKKIESGDITESDVIKGKLRALDYIAECNQIDLFHLIDTSAFNGIITSYVSESLKRAKADQRASKAVMNELTSLLDDSIFNLFNN